MDDWMAEPETAAGLQLFRGWLYFLVQILSISLTQHVIDFGPDSFIYLCTCPSSVGLVHISSRTYPWYIL